MDVAHWPLYGLRLRTPRLELRLPVLEELGALAQLSTQGVHDPDQMPFGVPWTDLPPAERARSVMQFHWRRKLGYQPNGLTRRQVRDTLRYEQRFALGRDRWQQFAAAAVEIDGLEPCLAQFGLRNAQPAA